MPVASERLFLSGSILARRAHCYSGDIYCCFEATVVAVYAAAAAAAVAVELAICQFTAAVELVIGQYTAAVKLAIIHRSVLL